MPEAFRGFPETRVPKGFGDWVDYSWYQDSAASCYKKVPTKKNPEARIVLYVDVVTPRYTLYWWKDEYVPDDGKKLYEGDSLAKLKAACKENQ